MPAQCSSQCSDHSAHRILADRNNQVNDPYLLYSILFRLTISMGFDVHVIWCRRAPYVFESRLSLAFRPQADMAIRRT